MTYYTIILAADPGQPAGDLGPNAEIPLTAADELGAKREAEEYAPRHGYTRMSLYHAGRWAASATFENGAWTWRPAYWGG